MNSNGKRGFGAIATGEGVPEDWRYSNQVTTALEDAHATYTQYTPQASNGPYSPGQNFKFNFGNDKMVGFDFRRAFFIFSATLTAGTGGTFMMLPRPVNAIFRELDVMWGSKATESIQQYSQLSWLLERHYESADASLGFSYVGDTVDSSGSMLQRIIGNQQKAQRDTLTTNSYYATGIHVGELTRKMIPIGMLDAVLWLTYYMHQLTDCYETDQTGSPTFSITDLQMFIPTYSLPKLYQNSLLQNVSASPNGFIVPFPMWRYQSDSQASGVGGQKMIKINAVTKNMKHIFFGFRRTANTNGTTNLDKISCFEAVANLNSYQLDIDGHRHPQVPIQTTDTGVFDFMHYLWGCNKWDSYTCSTQKSGFGNVGYTTWTSVTSSSQVYHLDLDDFESDGILSGKSVNEGGNNVNLILQFAAGGPAANMTIDIWMQSEEVFFMKANGSGRLTLEFPTI